MAHTYDLIEANISMKENTEKRETLKSLPLQSFFCMFRFLIPFQFREVKLKGFFLELFNLIVYYESHSNVSFSLTDLHS